MKEGKKTGKEFSENMVNNISGKPLNLNEISIKEC